MRKIHEQRLLKEVRELAVRYVGEGGLSRGVAGAKTMKWLCACVSSHCDEGEVINRQWGEG